MINCTSNYHFEIVIGAKLDFVNKLRKIIKADIFTVSDLKALLSPLTEAAIHNGVSRALKAKEFVQLRRGLYVFSKNQRHNSISKFSIANRLYGPSYVSFESALSLHGLIPEAVYSVTSACVQRKKKNFENDLGHFFYDYIPCSDFFLGVKYDDSVEAVLVANPLRALFDLIYLRKKNYKSVSELEADLRVDLNSLRSEVEKHSFSEIEGLAKLYKKKNVLKFFNVLMKEFK